MIINELNDEANRDRFKAEGLRRTAAYNYKCVVCGSKTNLDSSCSNNGAYLMCLECLHMNFNNPYQSYDKWTEAMLKNERINKTKYITDVAGVCEEVCDNLCKYQTTCDDEGICGYIRQGYKCQLDKLTKQLRLEG